MIGVDSFAGDPVVIDVDGYRDADQADRFDEISKRHVRYQTWPFGDCF